VSHDEPPLLCRRLRYLGEQLAVIIDVMESWLVAAHGIQHKVAASLGGHVRMERAGEEGDEADQRETSRDGCVDEALFQS
jgi:hypothetical protein